MASCEKNASYFDYSLPPLSCLFHIASFSLLAAFLSLPLSHYLSPCCFFHISYRLANSLSLPTPRSLSPCCLFRDTSLLVASLPNDLCCGGTLPQHATPSQTRPHWFAFSFLTPQPPQRSHLFQSSPSSWFRKQNTFIFNWQRTWVTKNANEAEDIYDENDEKKAEEKVRYSKWCLCRVLYSNAVGWIFHDIGFLSNYYNAQCLLCPHRGCLGFLEKKQWSRITFVWVRVLKSRRHKKTPVRNLGQEDS